MKPWRVDSLTARLLLSVLVATVTAWLAFAAVAYYEMRQHAGEQQRHQLAAYADMLWQGFGDDDDIHPEPGALAARCSPSRSIVKTAPCSRRAANRPCPVSARRHVLSGTPARSGWSKCARTKNGG